MKTRKSLLVLLSALLVFSFNYSCATIISKTLKLTPKENRVTVDKNVMIATRDGIHLATDVYRPAADGKFPAVLCRLPYGKNMIGQLGKVFAERGYVFVIQDCRATFNSEGDVFIAFVNDEMDGRDTVKWISGQPWFNGAMAAWGGSYFGYTQWQVADDNPYLKAFYPLITTPDMYKAIFTGGAFHYSLAKGWSMGVGKQNNASSMLTDMVFSKKPKWKPEEALFNKPLQPDLKYSFVELGKMPLEQLSVVLGLAPADKPMSPYPDAMDKMISMFTYPGFAYHSPTFNFFDRYKDVKAPAFMVSGWYDIFLKAQLDDFQIMKKDAPEPAKSGTRIVIGPWGHASLGYKEADKTGKTMTMFRDMFDIAWFDFWV